ncbi:PREDICTED: mechanosensitive ion channel protein 1, mitochondrial [Tarenaya hassleriana]|uniref:mechanosensitive ion channel protein 1, mitochondrial n=1 Tax=Tarenaya hassleriana TaxID=28532 RepID=UPI00053C5A12|nr:PREDICTED: mechanosensitive ion channel protein 1, mitochondrial [Tarenaya hassleriana]XP_010556567.1 PREDICTED: mechanosensitive ion channel protein 1, mitochondrial [Tarenaya hassleriana]
MAGVRFSVFKSLRSSINHSSKLQSFQVYKCLSTLGGYVDRRPSKSSTGFSNFPMKEPCPSFKLLNAHIGTIVSGSSLDGSPYRATPVLSIVSSPSNIRLHNARAFILTSPLLSHARSFSTNSDKPGNLIAPGATGSSSEVSGGNHGGSEIDWVDKVKDVWQTTVNTAADTARKAQEATDELNPHFQQLLDSHPYLKDVVVPVSLTLTGTVLAWVVMPRLLRRFHRYAKQSSAALLPGGLSQEDVPYERSFWGALEDPVRYVVTFMAFAQIGMMVAPTTVASQYLTQAWSGAVILSFVWFLHRWKTNVFARMLSAQTLAGIDREKLLTLDKVSSLGLFVIGMMALAEACGVAVQSILTVGGIGGVATAFAARDILGNVLSGLSIQFSKPFSLGDTIKAGSVEGQVVEMGLTTTSLLNAEKFPVLVPNSLFSSQVIVNKSRAQWRAIASKIPLQIEDLDKIPEISDEIKGTLRANAKVFLGKEAPYCYLSRVEKSFAELTIGCNLKHMNKDELYATQQEILLESVKIVKKHGASLGNSWDPTTFG